MAVLYPDCARAAGLEPANGRVDVSGERLATLGILGRSVALVGRRDDTGDALHVVNDEDLRRIRRRG